MAEYSIKTYSVMSQSGCRSEHMASFFTRNAAEEMIHNLTNSPSVAMTCTTFEKLYIHEDYTVLTQGGYDRARQMCGPENMEVIEVHGKAAEYVCDLFHFAEYVGCHTNSKIWFHWQDRVVEQYTVGEPGWQSWPGKHKNVLFWVVTASGKAIGLNENPGRGYSFPVLNMNHIRKGHGR